MPYPTEPFLGSFVGEGMFENDGALVAVTHLDELADLDKLTPTTTTNGGKVVYSLYAADCSSDEARELVRNHLDSGVLHKLAARMVSNYFNPLKMRDYTCGGFVPVILGACAMSHGCRTLYTAPGYDIFFKTYKDFLIGALPSAPLMDAAKEQMTKALHGPAGFEPGTPIDFKRFARPANYSPSPKNDACFARMLGGAPVGYKPAFEDGGSKDDGVATVGPCMKEQMAYNKDPKHCGSGHCKAGHATLVCSKCKVQVYCCKECQREDFHRHKVCCRTPEAAESMKDKGLWNNMFVVKKQSQLDDLATITRGKNPLEQSLDIFVAKLAGVEYARHFGVRDYFGKDLPV
jgi:hypothetical protein